MLTRSSATKPWRVNTKPATDLIESETHSKVMTLRAGDLYRI